MAKILKTCVFVPICKCRSSSMYLPQFLYLHVRMNVYLCVRVLITLSRES